MGKSARVTITSGPDRGDVHELKDELVHIGQDPDSQIALTDALVEDHQASIVRRNGRYAIYTPVEKAVEVDGSGIPSEQWVWLPTNSRIRLSETTTLLFEYEEAAATPDSDESAETQAKPRPKKQKKKTKGRKKPAASKNRKIAQFITDQDGDRLVRLGENGQLPELTLAETNKQAAGDRNTQQKSSSLMYIALGVSLLGSMAMLLIEPGDSSATRNERAEARKTIAKFYGSEATGVKPYQRLLREGRRAYSMGDKKGERRSYLKVFDMLNAEDIVNSNKYGLTLTGDKKDDNELRRLISVLLDP